MTESERQARLIILKSLKGNNVTNTDIYSSLLNKLTTTFNDNRGWIVNQFKILYRHGMTNVRVDYNSGFRIHTRTNHGLLLTPNGEDELNHLLN